VFGRLHPKHDFPQVSLLVMGLITAVGSFFTLTTIINVLLAVIVWVQAVAQIVALTVLRRRQPGLRRPYKQWLYPLPSLAALAGWLYVYASATATALVWSTVWLAAGVVAYLGWRATITAGRSARYRSVRPSCRPSASTRTRRRGLTRHNCRVRGLESEGVGNGRLVTARRSPE
jgi:amino acid transporter